MLKQLQGLTAIITINYHYCNYKTITRIDRFFFYQLPLLQLRTVIATNYHYCD